MSRKPRPRNLMICALVLGAGLAMAQALTQDTQNAALKAGEEAKGPWWMRQTAMTKDGTIVRLSVQPWWEKAAALKLGESFVIPVRGEAEGRMLVRREKFKIRTGAEVEAIVWVIDDDGDGSVGQGGDFDSDCYVADYGRDGVVDRLADYLDNDGDQVPDERPAEPGLAGLGPRP